MGWKGIAIVVVLFLVADSALCVAAPNRFLSGQNIGKGGTIYVDDNNTAGPWDGTLQHPYQYIQDGVNNASDGDTVFVFAGRYYERVNVTKTIHLLGENKTRTILYFQAAQGWWPTPVLSINTNGVVVSNFTINVTSGNGCCVNLSTASQCTISNNIIQGLCGIEIGIGSSCNNNEICNNIIQSKYGSYIGDFANPYHNSGNFVHHNYCIKSSINLDGNYTRNNIISDNYFDKCYYPAIELRDASDNTIERNTIIGDSTKENGEGIALNYTWVPFSGGNIIRNNIIKNCTGGGIATYTYGDTITGNLFENDGYGLSIHSYIVTITNNTIRNCTVGQDLWDANRPTILSGNVYDHCYEGIEVWECRNISFTHNTFSNDTYGALIYDSRHNYFSYNNFEHTAHDAFNQFSKNRWLHNYWGQPRTLPKPIFGIRPFLQFDWLPAQQPN